MARNKLKYHKDTQFIVDDFSNLNPNGGYDAIVSSLALHHLETNSEKKAFYRKIFNALKPGGIFMNADVVLASNDLLQNTYMDRWVEYIERSVPHEDIWNKWIPTYETEDHPARLTDQLVWLRESGFSETEVVWKYYNFAVYGGVK